MDGLTMEMFLHWASLQASAVPVLDEAHNYLRHQVDPVTKRARSPEDCR